MNESRRFFSPICARDREQIKGHCDEVTGPEIGTCHRNMQQKENCAPSESHGRSLAAMIVESVYVDFFFALSEIPKKRKKTREKKQTILTVTFGPREK